jgi:hypothetical protein
MTNAGLRIAPRADGSHARVAIFIVNNRPETMERIRPHVQVGSSHDAEAGRGALVSRAQRSTSRACTPVFAGYGDALHTRDRSRLWRSRISDASLRCARAASHPGHTSLGRVRSLIHFSNSPDLLVPAARFCARVFHLTFTHPEPKGWAERRRVHLVVVVAPLKARVGRVCETRRASCKACLTRSPLGAPPWRLSPRPRSAFGSFPETPSTSGDANLSSISTIRSQ